MVRNAKPVGMPATDPSLGTLISIHTRRKHSVRLFIGGWAVVLTGLIPARAAMEPGQEKVYLVALLFAFVGIFMAVAAVRRRNDQVGVMGGGLRMRVQDRRHIIPWKDIVSVRYRLTYSRVRGIPVNERWIVLSLANKSHVKIDGSFSDIEDLLKAVVREVTALRLEEARSEFEAGKTVHFGRMSLSRDALILGKSEIPWYAIEFVSVVENRLFVKRSDRSMTRLLCPAFGIENVHVFLPLLESRVGVEYSTHSELLF